jgi:uncharacterized protein
MTIPTRTASAWREPMVWLMIGLPLAAVLASVSLVVTAVRTDNNDSVRDDVRHTAQIQTVELGPDARAQVLALSAVLRVGASGVDVLPVAGDFARNAPLELVLAHPTEAARDRHLQLRPTELGWHAATAPDVAHDWLLEIAPADHAWRLRGRLRSGEHAAHLAPALGVAVDPGG